VAVCFLVGASLACGLPASSGPPPEIVIEPTVRPTLAEAALATLAAPTVAPTAASAAVTELASSAFRDDFNGTLDPGWSWFKDDSPGWTLSNMPGWLRLNLSTGSFFSATPPANLLLRPAPSGDFELETWLRFSPYRNFEIAGLVVVFDDHSVLQFGRGFCEVPSAGAGCIGDGLHFDNIQNNASVGGNFATPSYLGVDYLLRLQRQGNNYVASFTPDNAPGGNLGTHAVEKSPVSIGLIAAQAETAGNYADFDYVEITDGP
jgi:hypothetical protein